MSGTSLDLSQIRTDALSSAASFRTLIGVDITSFATAAQGTKADTALQPAAIASGTITPKTGNLDLNSIGGENSFSTFQPQTGGSNGTAVAADSSSDTLTLNANCGAVISGNASTDTLTLDCIGVPVVAWQAGSADYYLTSPSQAYNTLALVANRKYLTAVIVPRRMTITSARIAVTTFATSSLARIGLRRVNIQTGQPTTLVADFGEVDTSTNGVKAITGLSQVVDPGFYYFELVSNGTPTIRSANPNLLGVNLAPSGGFAIGSLTGLFRAFTYAALPADETSQTQTENTGQSPVIMLRYT